MAVPPIVLGIFAMAVIALVTKKAGVEANVKGCEIDSNFPNPELGREFLREMNSGLASGIYSRSFAIGIGNHLSLSGFPVLGKCLGDLGVKVGRAEAHMDYAKLGESAECLENFSKPLLGEIGSLLRWMEDRMKEKGGSKIGWPEITYIAGSLRQYGQGNLALCVEGFAEEKLGKRPNNGAMSRWPVWGTEK